MRARRGSEGTAAMTLRRRATAGVLWAFAERFSQELIGFVVFVLLARLLGPADFGVVALAGVFVAFTGLFLDMGFSSAIIQRRDLKPADLDTAFWMNVGISVPMCLLLMGLSGPIANAFDQPALGSVLVWLSPVLILRALVMTQQTLLRRNFGFRALALRGALSLLTGGIAGVALAMEGAGPYSLVAQQWTMALTAIVVLWRASKWRPGFQISRESFRSLFTFGLPLVGDAVVRFVSDRSAVLLIGYQLGAAASGLFAVSSRVMRHVLGLTGMTVNRVTLPAFSELQTDRQRLVRAYYATQRYSAMASFPAFAGLIAVAPEALVLLLGERWAEAALVVQIMALGQLLGNLAVQNTNVMIAVGRPNLVFRLQVARAIFSVVGVVIALRWGILGVAIALALRPIIFMPLGWYLVSRLIDLRFADWLRAIRAPLLAMLAMSAVLLGLRLSLAGEVSPNLLLAILIVVGALTYVLMLWLIEPATARDIRSTLGSLRRSPRGQRA